MSERIKIKYWWSEDHKWFCVLVDDGNTSATVSLTPEEASMLSMNATHPDIEAELAELREALIAQVEVSTMLMRRLDFSDRDIADCTAQARRVLGAHTPHEWTKS